ncbi:MAG TPA: PepSY-associated TM helix domain-containing protein [Solirubrobacteraceae bacterium]|nr:PepSY-associated TM helix domain-containing protein [Solirubrobacteraceae bacterium]
MQRGHRWAAMVTGLFLLMMTLSGVILLYAADLQKLLHPSLYDATRATQTISAQRARAAALAAVPGFQVDRVIKNRGIWAVRGDLPDGQRPQREIHVDPGTGNVLGIADTRGGVLGVLTNLHTCALGCDDYAGYWGATAYELNVLGNELRVGELLLGLVALALLGLSLSGIVLWWPGIKRMARGFALRRRKGRYAVNYDLHKLAGMAAIPFLLMWAITGAGFEFNQVGQAWYALLPGAQPAEQQDFESKPIAGRSVSMSQAERIARELVPSGRLSSVTLPEADKKESAYTIRFSEGVDPRQYDAHRGDVRVAVDQYSGRAEITDGDPSVKRPVSQVVWESWDFPIHTGTPVNGALRTPWVLFGLAPLLLAVTGMTTWLLRRRKRRAKGARLAI